MNYYVLIVKDDLAPELVGPYEVEYEANLQAMALKAKYGDDHGIFWLDVYDDQRAQTGSFNRGFLDPGWKKVLVRMEDPLDDPVVESYEPELTAREISRIVKRVWGEKATWKRVELPEAMA